MRLQQLFVHAALVMAAPVRVIKRQSASCPSYTIINTRGTGEEQGESNAFRTMNDEVSKLLPGSSIYNTVYPASFNQDSRDGTADIIREVYALVDENPDECIILEGYSQGAAALVYAMDDITGAAFDAVKGVVMVGNPLHRSGLECNVDNKGGTSTRDVNGITWFFGRVPDDWVSKTRDICIKGDGVCDTKNGFGITIQHLFYSIDSSTQELGANFILEQLG